jgi:hypothetical protein
MGELIASAYRKLNRHAKAFDGHDRNGTYKGAYRDVDEGIGPAVSRDYCINHDQGEDEHGKTVQEEAWIEE